MSQVDFEDINVFLLVGWLFFYVFVLFFSFFNFYLFIFLKDLNNLNIFLKKTKYGIVGLEIL